MPLLEILSDSGSSPHPPTSCASPSPTVQTLFRGEVIVYNMGALVDSSVLGVVPSSRHCSVEGPVQRVKTAVVAALLLGVVAPAASQSRADDADTIRRVIASAYIDGIHKNGSREAIRAGFHPSFVMKVLGNDSLTDVTIEQWIARLPGEGTPVRRAVTHRIPDVSISGHAAVARVEVMFDGRHTFTDYKSLYRFSEGWRIVGKIFNTEET